MSMKKMLAIDGNSILNRAAWIGNDTTGCSCAN